MLNKGFEGWYFKHQAGDYMLSFIPGISKTGAFIQVIDNNGVYIYDMPGLAVKNNNIFVGNCSFSKRGIKIDLPDFCGELEYQDITPLKSDIMGLFKYLPMQCRHGVISMGHNVFGQMQIKGKQINFNNAKGYIEKDSGYSFPRSYIWMQCNSFEKPCSVMVSIAHIPFCGFSFTGCICALIFENREYRFATYNGVKILNVAPENIKLKQGDFILEIDMKPENGGYALKSPKNGQMSNKIKESCNAFIHIKLHCKNQAILDLKSNYAAYESML